MMAEAEQRARLHKLEVIAIDALAAQLFAEEEGARIERGEGPPTRMTWTALDKAGRYRWRLTTRDLVNEVNP